MERFGAIGSSVDSPCINVCRLDESGVCTGCGRLLSEIADWSRMTNQKKREVCEQATNRLRRKHRQPPIPEALATNSQVPKVSYLEMLGISRILVTESEADPTRLARVSTPHLVHLLKSSCAKGHSRPIVASLGRSGT
jgi:predicted Fe-S protein YdhL (DUF1289 family)